jgi:hypothetical protein
MEKFVLARHQNQHARRDCRTLAFLAQNRHFSDVLIHQNHLAKKQNDLWTILERRVFKVRQSRDACATRQPTLPRIRVGLDNE